MLWKNRTLIFFQDQFLLVVITVKLICTILIWRLKPLVISLKYVGIDIAHSQL